jgi:hypothetical protein
MSVRPGPRPGADDNRWSDGPPLPRWALWLMLPGIAAPVVIFAFILLTESAHDPSRCPYREVERRTVAQGAVVREEARSCLSGVEERRYTLERTGTAPRVLGERRFDKAAFANGYRWEAHASGEGEVQLTVHNPGHDDLLLREGTPEERAKGISR